MYNEWYTLPPVLRSRHAAKKISGQGGYKLRIAESYGTVGQEGRRLQKSEVCFRRAVSWHGQNTKIARSEQDADR